MLGMGDDVTCSGWAVRRREEAGQIVVRTIGDVDGVERKPGEGGVDECERGGRVDAIAQRDVGDAESRGEVSCGRRKWWRHAHYAVGLTLRFGEPAARHEDAGKGLERIE